MIRLTWCWINTLGTNNECLLIPTICWSWHKNNGGRSDAIYFGWLFWGFGWQLARLPPNA